MSDASPRADAVAPRTGPALGAGVVLVAALAMCGLALAPARADRGDRTESVRRTSKSLGYPWRGRLRDGVILRPNPHVRYTPDYVAAGNFWGTWELVSVVERAAERVARRMPGAPLSIGELSKPHGGDIEGHGSHENGRDVDLAFYMLAGDRPFAPQGFAEFDGRGRGVGQNRALRFDDARNWELVSRLVTDPDARVQYIFVGAALRDRILAEGRRRGAPAAALDRAAAVLVQPATGHPHKNHFHVRIYCPPASRPDCKDRPPFHPWYPGPLPTADVRRPWF